MNFLATAQSDASADANVKCNVFTAGAINYEVVTASTSLATVDLTFKTGLENLEPTKKAFMFKCVGAANPTTAIAKEDKV